ncbi:limonene 1,2-monooxygenase [Variibacter gotjawalensis]|uniref:Luciferase-like monooxygenase n=1 Tax=Variibacter gotjawalensis TaxID=1333996 RepID=A0A0S3PSY2_9BRAD|nr:LLM class flavin-dependent oxidoreductase [Variibacter gotjawalensis]NIK49394.1 luciferase family oxidoreductase group 1 [Variibacter gotjawalensis]RZS51246.1 luciferase family oxidoreductase group 1 [Variibacter gotjawalensis]BAT59079.1 limonene 1,2-monooxygenase [Variibacter gotjawalensis]
MLPLSVLDLSPVTTETSAAQALANTIDLGRHADALGYTRYWMAEHHNLPNIASGAPDIMIGQVAAATKTIRVGAGGIMLPNHPPLMVAERFKVLEALFPDRIDLGLGRAPGTDQVTWHALRRRQEVSPEDDFLERFQELVAFEAKLFPEQHPYSKITVMPAGVALPPIWLLGSSEYSAQLAAAVGMGYSFASHFSDLDASGPMRAYKAQFKPSHWRETPYSILAVHAIVADTDAEAERLASTVELNFARRAQGLFVPLASPEEAQAYPYTPVDRDRIKRNRSRVYVGSPKTVKERLDAVVETTQADEIMVTSFIFDHAARKRSYELLMQAFKG